MRALIALLAASASLAAAPIAPAVAASVPRCGYVRASVPYAAHGHADRWGVFVTGAPCAKAVEVLGAVMHLHAKQHLGATEAGSYFTFGGWLCPFGSMGVQSCELPTRLPAHPPIRARALAIDCTTAARGCPAELPSSDL